MAMTEPGMKTSSPIAISTIEEGSYDNLQPIERFLIALKAPETKRQYPKRLESFFDFLRFHSFEEKTILFYKMIKIEKNSE